MKLEATYEEQKVFANNVIIATENRRQLNEFTHWWVPSATQSGKTRAMIEVVKQYKNLVSKSERLLVVIYGPPVVNVRNATHFDFVENGISEIEIWKAHTEPRVKNFISWQNVDTDSANIILKEIKDIRKNGGHIIHINDEADAGTGVKKKDNESFAEDPQTKKSPQLKLRDYARNHDIPLYDIEPPEDAKSKEISLHISATFAHFLEAIKTAKELSGVHVVEMFQLGSDEKYAGIDTLESLGVFEDSRRFHGGKKSQDALIELAKSRVIADLSEEDPCYHVFRVPSKDKTRKGIESETRALGAEVYYHDANRNNISELTTLFDAKPDVPTVILIKQGFSRGSRINTVDHIATWVSLKIKNDAAVLQDVGRLTGRLSGPADGAKNPRSESYHPRLKIYADISAIVKESSFVNIQREGTAADLVKHIQGSYGQSGTWCKEVTASQDKWSFVAAYTFDCKERARAFVFDRIDATGRGGVFPSANSIKLQNKNDLAADWDKVRWHKVRAPNKCYQLIDAREPNPGFMESWESFPYKGKWVVTEHDLIYAKGSVAYDAQHGIT